MSLSEIGFCPLLSAAFEKLHSLRVSRRGTVRWFRCSVEQLLTVMPDEEHFLFSEGTINGHTSEEIFACVSEGTYVLF